MNDRKFPLSEMSELPFTGRPPLMECIARLESSCGLSQFGLQWINDFNQVLAAARMSNAAPPVALTWRCFHCDECFTVAAEARLHFGSSERQQPACQIDIAEYRRMEEVNRRHCEEDTDLHRAMHRMSSEHQQALRREEEKGYARGLRDAKLHPAELGLALASPPATTRAASPPRASDAPLAVQACRPEDRAMLNTSAGAELLAKAAAALIEPDAVPTNGSARDAHAPAQFSNPDRA